MPALPLGAGVSGESATDSAAEAVVRAALVELLGAALPQPAAATAATANAAQAARRVDLIWRRLLS